MCGFERRESPLVPFAATFPSPRRAGSPGHLIAIATSSTGPDVIVWRWYDALVLGREGSGSVRLWEVAHGEVVAQARRSCRDLEPGERAYASAGLPGADWWVAGSVAVSPESADVDSDEVHSLYDVHGLWAAAFEL